MKTPWKITLIISAVIAILAISVFVSTSLSGKAANIVDSSSLPSFATADARTEQAYRYALELGDEFEYIACYCGCGIHAMTHRGKMIPQMNNLRECFVRDDGTFEDHAAIDCPACVTLALETSKMIEEGKSLREIRNTIDRRYGVAGAGTPTPYPPEV